MFLCVSEQRTQSNCVSESSGLTSNPPRCLGFEHQVKYCQQLTHAGDERHREWLVFSYQPFVELFDNWITAGRWSPDLTRGVESHYLALRNTGNASVEYSFRKYVVEHVVNRPGGRIVRRKKTSHDAAR